MVFKFILILLISNSSFAQSILNNLETISEEKFATKLEHCFGDISLVESGEDQLRDNCKDSISQASENGVEVDAVITKYFNKLEQLSELKNLIKRYATVELKARIENMNIKEEMGCSKAIRLMKLNAENKLFFQSICGDKN